ncbi:Hypothetical protein NTJ_10298 [Nesidiocoris tenuis]|uniref:Dynein regulatory complex protein 10 n=1 Tax=Nesidiocoris tenuis TaxID=355587 RepID=A0ABN7B1P5_9HEMI|nr:Hypothetical protein NTJ_10298 [Nesidiocoris tenuis]
MSQKESKVPLFLRKKSEFSRPADHEKGSGPVFGREGDRLCDCSCMGAEKEIFFKNEKRGNSASRKSLKSLHISDGSLQEESDSYSLFGDKTLTAGSLSQRIEDKLLRKAQERAPPERANVQLEVEKLKKLFNETIKFLEFSMLIPEMAKNDYALLRKILPKPQLVQIKSILEPIGFEACTLFSSGEYEVRRKNFFTESSASSIEKFYSEYKEKESAENQLVESAWTAATMLYEKYQSQPELFPQELMRSVPDHVRELIDSLDKLFNHVLDEMKRSPQEAEEEEIQLSRMYLAFESLGAEMIHLHRNLRPSFEANLRKILEICRDVHGLKEQRRKLNEFLVNSHQRIRSNLEKKTMMYNLEAMKSTKEKMGPRKELIARHHNLVKEDLAEEKNLRVQKYKSEQVLQSVISKYDENMAIRNQKLAHLNEMYEAEMAKMKLMQERYDTQEKIYSLLMDEKNKYEEAELAAKLQDIRRRIAARRIQRFYRGYMAFMLAHGRKKGKGKGRGKKRA